jgi:hypothetical protein
MLFGDICLVASPALSGYVIAITECFWLVIGLITSIGIGHIESRIKHKEFKLSEEIAVVPGIALVMLALMIKGLVWRLME